MRPTLLALLAATVLSTSCGGSPMTDQSAVFERAVCAGETTRTPTPFVAAADTATATTHQLGSSETPYLVALPTGAQGFVGIHVAEMHTTMEVIVKHAGDVGAASMGGVASDLVFDTGPVAGTTCTDLTYYKLHADLPGDYELALPSNAANSTWLAFEIIQVGHDVI